jgi:hypothetical protein
LSFIDSGNLNVSEEATVFFYWLMVFWFEKRSLRVKKASAVPRKIPMIADTFSKNVIAMDV